MVIDRRRIGRDCPPFVIAEISGNHNQSLERALQLVDAAATAGAHAIKLQTYTADTMTLDLHEGGFFIDDRTSPWHGSSLYQLYESAHTPWDWHRPVMQRARDRGLICFSTPFDDSAVDFLEALDVPAYKIASFENADLPLIRKVASTGKPVMISTGLATFVEIEEAVQTARAAGCRDLVLLKCTSAYPASPDHSNVLTVPHLRASFSCEVGLSDHTMGLGASVAAVAHGATVIEKHLTLRRADGGVDSSFSLEPEEFASLVSATHEAWQALGGIRYGPSPDEQGALGFRRSLYIVRDCVAGEVLGPNDIRRIRPGLGVPPRDYDQVIGRRLRRDAARGTPVTWDLLA